jgi:hypothetical protein
MGHCISALIAKAPIDLAAAGRLDLPVFVQSGFAIVALFPEHCDHWAEKLGLAHQGHSGLLLDCPVTHAFAERLGLEKYALIETNYFGGIGEQWAAVYSGGRVDMQPTIGGINAALQLLGVEREHGFDEFDTIGLAHHRSFDRFFEKYWR